MINSEAITQTIAELYRERKDTLGVLLQIDLVPIALFCIAREMAIANEIKLRELGWNKE